MLPCRMDTTWSNGVPESHVVACPEQPIWTLGLGRPLLLEKATKGRLSGRFRDSRPLDLRRRKATYGGREASLARDASAFLALVPVSSGTVVGLSRDSQRVG